MSKPCRTARDDIERLQFLLSTEGSRFYPLDKLREYFNGQRKRVQQIMHCDCTNCRTHLAFFDYRPNTEEYISHLIGGRADSHGINHTYYSVFALLIYIEHPMLISGFIRGGCTDLALEGWNTGLFSLSEESLAGFTGSYKNDGWSFKTFVKDFVNFLPEFSLPHMDTTIFSYYNARTILPFVEEHQIGQKTNEEGQLTSEDANGRVFAIKIHGEYFRSQTAGDHRELVRKRIETDQAQAFLEQAIIQHVQRFKDPHIVKLVKAYSHGESINLILPRALTNLNHLLRNPQYRYFEQRGTMLEDSNAWKQLLGIAKALEKTHRLGDEAGTKEHSCVHFDLKADNILVEHDGTWIITDFGQAALTQNRPGSTRHVGGHFGTDAYAPPEIDYNGNLHRAYDIWSFACIILEVTAFLVYGYPGLVGSPEFKGLDKARAAKLPGSNQEDSRFFYNELASGKYVVKPEIRDFITALEQQYSQSNDRNQRNEKFLKRITGLLYRMLQPNADDRVPISRIVDVLSNMVEVATSSRVRQFVPALGEISLGEDELNKIRLWHRKVSSDPWRDVSLYAFESEGFIRLFCCVEGSLPSEILFRRVDVQIIPHYAFWDSRRNFETKAWIQFLLLNSGTLSPIVAMFSFDGNNGLNDAHVVQSKLTSQHIEGSFSLSKVCLMRSESLAASLKNHLSKWKSTIGRDKDSGDKFPRNLEFDSATVQIWSEEERFAEQEPIQQLPISSTLRPTRELRHILEDGKRLPTRRVVIYLHEHRFICTVKIGVNWVLKKDDQDPRRLRLEPYRSTCFHASWLRPTTEEFAAGFPAGIPLSPMLLQRYEDAETFAIRKIELQFLSPEDSKYFNLTYQNVKRDWWMEREKLGIVIPVNREPKSTARKMDPLHNTSPPTTRRKSQLMTVENKIQSRAKGLFQPKPPTTYGSEDEVISPITTADSSGDTMTENAIKDIRDEFSVLERSLIDGPSVLKHSFSGDSMIHRKTEVSSGKDVIVDNTIDGLQDEIFALKPRLVLENIRKKDIPPPYMTDSKTIERNLAKDSGIASEAPTETSQAIAIAIQQLGSFFIELKELRALHRDVLLHIGEKDFENRYYIAFETYGLQLHAEAHSVIEKAAAQFLDSRTTWAALAREMLAIAKDGDMEDSTTMEGLKKYEQQPVEYKMSRPPSSGGGEEDMKDYERSEGDSEEENAADCFKRLTVPEIAQLKEFLLRGNPFQNLVRGLRLLVLPEFLGEILDCIPKHAIEIMPTVPSSTINKLKAFIESYSAMEWDWWPFPPRVPDLRPGQLLLKWEFCDQSLFQVISSEEAKSIEQI